MAVAHAAHAAVQHDPAGSARTFLGETALPAVRALNRAGAPMLLLAMHQVVNLVRPGLYRYWMEWRTSNQSGRPLSTGDTLRLTGEGSATSLRSSAPALLHARSTRHSMDAAPYLNQVRATYLGGVYELDAAPHLLRPQDEDLEVGEVTIFVEGAGETPTRPRPINPVYDGTKPTPLYAVMCEAFPREPTWCTPSRRPPKCPAAGPTHARPPPPLQDQGWPAQTAGPRERAPRHLPAAPCRHAPQTTPERVLGFTSTHLYGAAPVPCPPLLEPEARDGVHAFLRTQEVTAVR